MTHTGHCHCSFSPSCSCSSFVSHGIIFSACLLRFVTITVTSTLGDSCCNCSCLLCNHCSAIATVATRIPLSPSQCHCRYYNAIAATTVLLSPPQCRYCHRSFMTATKTTLSHTASSLLFLLVSNDPARCPTYFSQEKEIESPLFSLCFVDDEILLFILFLLWNSNLELICSIGVICVVIS